MLSNIESNILVPNTPICLVYITFNPPYYGVHNIIAFQSSELNEIFTAYSPVYFIDKS
jgi:hypothetical protein